MLYSFGLVKHANVRYRDTVRHLSRCELVSMLRSISIDSDVYEESLGGCVFLSFESRCITPDEISYLSGHSSVSFMAENNKGLLRPLIFQSGNYMEDDLPEILKYKGKTSASFTRMMLNTARALSASPFPETPATVLDPMCGKATTCFCALQSGMNAVGLDLDSKAIREAVDYFSRYLRFHMLKHDMQKKSETSGNHPVPYTEFRFSQSREQYRQNDIRTLKLGTCDTADSYSMCRKSLAQLIIADLPYGIQHAPQFGAKPESFSVLLKRALPVWKKCLAPGGIIAVSFNTLTFPTKDVDRIAVSSGLSIVDDPLYANLAHEVEQSVVRNVRFFTNNP